MDLLCIRVKGCKSECFRTFDGVRQGCIVSFCLFNMYMNAVMKVAIMGGGKSARVQVFRERFEGIRNRWCLMS